MNISNKVLAGLIAVLFIAVAGLYILTFTKAEKIAYIDTGKLLSEYKEMQTLKKQLEEETGKAKANVDTLTIEFQNSLKEYEKNQSRMSPKEKALSQELLRNKQNQFIQFQKAMEQKVGQEEQKQTQIVLGKVNAFISEYGEKKGYKLIFATSNGNIAYGDKGVNITDEIIKGLNGIK